MGEPRLGRTLVIANPASQSGRGEQGARFVSRVLGNVGSATDGFEIRRTTGPGNATQIARASTGFDTVLALGGDGVIHEVVNGLMQIGDALRPRLGVIPLGSGNDYARTLGMAANAPERSLGQVLQGTFRRLDVGCVNGTYFVQSLSFGLDAAIALDTMERRRRHGAHGTRLFAGSGINLIRRGLVAYPFRATFDGRVVEGAPAFFAVQVGPTYGGGFRICPDADETDGLLDTCRSEGLPGVPYALALLASARLGAHTRSPYLRFARISRATIDFEREPPAQVDGERLTGTHFEVRCLHRALEAIVPPRRA